MFSLTIVFGASSPVLWTMLYQSEERAKAAFDKVMSSKGPSAFGANQLVTIEDDFSQSACIESSTINGFMIEDMDKSQLGQVEKALHERRAQVKFEALVNADPGMRPQQRQPSMPILQPMGNGFRPVS